MFFQHFVECIFHFNNYEKHEKYNKFSQSERSVSSGEGGGGKGCRGEVGKGSHILLPGSWLILAGPCPSLHVCQGS